MAGAVAGGVEHAELDFADHDRVAVRKLHVDLHKPRAPLSTAVCTQYHLWDQHSRSTSTLVPLHGTSINPTHHSVPRINPTHHSVPLHDTSITPTQYHSVPLHGTSIAVARAPWGAA
eukprot:336471-Rhodomonas_salina.1